MDILRDETVLYLIKNGETEEVRWEAWMEAWMRDILPSPEEMVRTLI